VVAAAGAGACFFWSGRHWGLLLVAPVLCLLRLWFNMLDGMVALASGKASLRGEIVNELPDRVSDVVIFAGMAHSGLANPYLGYWAAIMAVMTAYVGTLGQAVTGKRRFEGVMSKQWRMVWLCIGALGVAHQQLGKPPRFPALDTTCVIVIVGCVQTIGVRLWKILAELKDKAE
jgi:phosphatidylglycerophosphate synthase